MNQQLIIHKSKSPASIMPATCFDVASMVVRCGFDAIHRSHIEETSKKDRSNIDAGSSQVTKKRLSVNPQKPNLLIFQSSAARRNTHFPTLKSSSSNHKILHLTDFQKQIQAFLT